VAILAVIQVHHVRSVGRERRAVVGDALALLDDVVVTQEGIGYPTVTGAYAGWPVRIELIVDTLTLRQLPRLWLAVTLRRELPVEHPVDVLLRPMSSDIVSPGLRFGHVHAPPPSWPEHLRVATPVACALPPLAGPALDGLLADERTKSVLVAPGGVRVVTELARGDVGSHRVARRPVFTAVLEPERVRAVLEDELEIARGLAARVPVGSAA
jgi:hypothetical protein